MRRQTLTLLASALLAVAGCGKYSTLAKTSLDAAAPLKVTFDGDLSACEQYLCLVALTASPSEADGKIALKKGSRLVRVLADGSWAAFEMADEDKDKDGEAKAEDAAATTEGEAPAPATTEGDPPKAPTPDGDPAPVPATDGEASPGTDGDASPATEGEASPATEGEATPASSGDAAAAATSEAPVDEKKKKKGKKDEKEEVPENWAETPAKSYDDLKAESLKKAMGNATKELAKGTLVTVDGAQVLELSPDLLPAGKFLLYTNGWFGASYEGTRLGSPGKFGYTQVSR